MKRVLVVLAVILSSSFAFAAEEASVSIAPVVSINYIQDKEGELDPKINYGLGGRIFFNLPSSSYLFTGLEYQTYTIGEEGSAFGYTGIIKENLEYLEVPIGAMFTIADIIYIPASVNLLFNTGAKVEGCLSETGSSSTNCSDLDDIKDEMKSFAVSAKAGLGVKLGGLFVDLTYTQTLTDIYDGRDGGLKGYKLNAGFMF